MTFAEPPLSLEHHLQNLQQRGLIFDDIDHAKQTLKHSNYYRLACYFPPFLTKKANFRQGTRFADIMALYTFDKELRARLWAALGTLELSFRATWAYHLAHALGAHAYLDKTLFDKQQNGISKALKKEARRSKEAAFLAYYQQYQDPESPPIWLVCELMSFGQLSKSFQNLQSKRVRKKIAAEYGLPAEIYGSFLNQASHLRNLCAHHGRVWNREFTFLFQLPKKRPAGWLHYFDRRKNSKGDIKNRQLYNSVVMLMYLMTQVETNRAWGDSLRRLLAAHKDKLEAMGFPSHWRRMALWHILAEEVKEERTYQLLIRMHKGMRGGTIAYHNLNQSIIHKKRG